MKTLKYPLFPPVADESFVYTLSASTAQDFPIPQGEDGKASAKFAIITKVGADSIYVKAGATATIGAGAASAGYQDVRYTSVVGANATGLTQRTAGYQDWNYKIGYQSLHATSLVNDATAYTATVAVDGGAPQNVSVVGSAAQTFGALITQINADLTGATAALLLGKIRITSATVGSGSSISISNTDLFNTASGAANSSGAASAVAGTNPTYTYSISINGGGASERTINGHGNTTWTTLVAALNTNLNLLGVSGYQVVDVGGAKTGGSATGLANDATVYTAAVVVDGGASQPISIVGSAAQTYTTLIAELDTDTSGVTWAIVGGNLRATSDSTGTTSTVAITDTDLFGTLTSFVSIQTGVPGTRPADASIAADGRSLRLTSTTTGASSAIALTDGTLLAALPGFQSVRSAIAGKAQTAGGMLNPVGVQLDPNQTVLSVISAGTPVVQISFYSGSPGE